MAEAPAQRATTRQLDEALIKRLEELCLDVDYWVEALETQCGIKKYGQLKFLNHSALDKLQKIVQFDWEKNALGELLGIREGQVTTQKPRNEGKTRVDKIEVERVKQMRLGKQIQEDDWIKGGKHGPIDDLIRRFSSEPDEPMKQTSDTSEWSVTQDETLTSSSPPEWNDEAMKETSDNNEWPIAQDITSTLASAPERRTCMDTSGDQKREGIAQNEEVPRRLNERPQIDSDKPQNMNEKEKKKNPNPNRSEEEILSQLGLKDFYPSKISLQDVMAVQNRSHKKQTDLPWLILQKLIMLDFNGRESDLQKYNVDEDNAKGKNPSVNDFLQEIAAGECDDMTLNPLDVFVTTFACCDMVFKQILVQKMFSCRLAVPFISPQLSNESWLYSLWALRNIIIEWKDRQGVCTETSVVSQPLKTVTFLKLGELSSSKSALVNNVISNQHHHTFWNRECPLGESEHPLANGLVEAQWYLPSGKEDDIFDDVTMFLNLRGNACEHKRQLQVLGNISNVIVSCLKPADLDAPEVLETMKRIHGSRSNVVILLEMKELEGKKLQRQLDSYFTFVGISHKKNTQMISTLKGRKARTTEDLKQELRKVLRTQLDGALTSIEYVSEQARAAGIAIDEDDKHCQRGKELAGEVKLCIERKPMNECKREMLPLQGEHWRKWSELLKSQQSPGGKGKELSTMKEIARITSKMANVRKDQLRLCTNLTPLMKTFLGNLMKVKDSPAAILYLQWMKIYLDEVCRRTLPDLHKQYHQKWRELKAAAGRSKDCPEAMPTGKTANIQAETISCLRNELADVEKTLADSSLGVEHLLREVGQIYEAAHEMKPESIKDMVKELPEIVAQLLLKGLPMEIMDGDAANVPLTWVEAVFTNLIKLVGDKKLFVISVLGIQSSGKSTLLNTMFGLQFAVSAGRCTRGVYMQLIKVDKEDKERSNIPYDYALVFDTEGLRAPELGHEKFDNDNQLATFVIGLGDVTILNIKGENVAEISNVLQIAVHAFLRMKLSDNNFQTQRSCHFIHQNVAALNAKTKMQQGTKVVQDKLDQMTVEACAMEHIIDIHSFNQVIKFDSETNVWHISDLWYGDPPMAPINPGYTAKVQEIRNQLLKGTAQNGETYLRFSDMSIHVKDLWRAVLSENFVFSFRNSLAAKAYNSLEKTYNAMSWEVEKCVTEWLMQKATVGLERCTSTESLAVQYSKLKEELREQGIAWREKACSDLEQYFDAHNLKDIVIEWKTQKLNSLQTEIKRVLDTAAQKLLDHNENVRIHLLQKVKFADIDVVIMSKARDFANKMKGKEANDLELKEMFKAFWIKSVEELTPKICGTSTAIDKVVEDALYKYLEKESAVLKEELMRTDTRTACLKRGIALKDIDSKHVSMEKTWDRIKGVVTNAPMENCRLKAVEIINAILQTIDRYLADITSQDSDFQAMFAANVVQIVMQGIDNHNNSKVKRAFALRPQLMVRTAVFACHAAQKVFDRMHEEYEDRHSVTKKLDAKRDAAWGLFKNMVRDRSNEVIVADLLSADLEKLVKQGVKKGMALKVENEMLRHFGHQKWNLLTKILGNLSEKSFGENRSFLADPKSYALEWITSVTKKEIFNATSTAGSKYADFANVDTEKFIKGIEEAIGKATELVLGQQSDQEPKGQKWVKYFCASLVILPVSKQNLKYVTEYNVKDFENLNQLLMERLSNMRESVLMSFKAEKPNSIKWEGTTPYKQILNKLWGCEARCPFCREVCQRTDPNHLSPNDSHQCIQHRPSGVSGSRWESDDMRNGKLCVETCNFNVQSKTRFKRDGEWHPFKEYKKQEPNWDIAPSADMESTKYWMWLMAKYKDELADWYSAKVPDIPEEWGQITPDQACDSLRVYQD